MRPLAVVLLWHWFPGVELEWHRESENEVRKSANEVIRRMKRGKNNLKCALPIFNSRVGVASDFQKTPKTLGFWAFLFLV